MELFKGLSDKYTEIWKNIISPQRQLYYLSDLGAKIQVIHNTEVIRHDIDIKSSKGHILKCTFYAPEKYEQNNIGCVVYLHGNAGSRVEALTTLNYLLPRTALFCFDFAGSGKSEGDYVTLGVIEAQDLALIVHYIKSHIGIHKIALWGRSMGAVTAINFCATRPKEIMCMVLDSGFIRLSVLMEEIGKEKMNIPSLLVDAALHFIKNKITSLVGVDIFELDLLEEIKKIRDIGGIIFGCAEKDSVIMSYHTQRLFEQFQGEKILLKFEGDHNTVRPPFFFKQVVRFLEKQLYGQYNHQDNFPLFKPQLSLINPRKSDEPINKNIATTEQVAQQYAQINLVSQGDCNNNTSVSSSEPNLDRLIPKKIDYFLTSKYAIQQNVLSNQPTQIKVISSSSSQNHNLSHKSFLELKPFREKLNNSSTHLGMFTENSNQKVQEPKQFKQHTLYQVTQQSQDRVIIRKDSSVYLHKTLDNSTCLIDRSSQQNNFCSLVSQLQPSPDSSNSSHQQLLKKVFEQTETKHSNPHQTINTNTNHSTNTFYKNQHPQNISTNFHSDAPQIKINQYISQKIKSQQPIYQITDNNLSYQGNNVTRRLSNMNGSLKDQIKTQLDINEPGRAFPAKLLRPELLNKSGNRDQMNLIGSTEDSRKCNASSWTKFGLSINETNQTFSTKSVDIQQSFPIRTHNINTDCQKEECVTSFRITRQGLENESTDENQGTKIAPKPSASVRTLQEIRGIDNRLEKSLSIGRAFDSRLSIKQTNQIDFFQNSNTPQMEQPALKYTQKHEVSMIKTGEGVENKGKSLMEDCPRGLYAFTNKHIETSREVSKRINRNGTKQLYEQTNGSNNEQTNESNNEQLKRDKNEKQNGNNNEETNRNNKDSNKGNNKEFTNERNGNNYEEIVIQKQLKIQQTQSSLKFTERIEMGKQKITKITNSHQPSAQDNQQKYQSRDALSQALVEKIKQQRQVGDVGVRVRNSVQDITFKQPPKDHQTKSNHFNIIHSDGKKTPKNSQSISFQEHPTHPVSVSIFNNHSQKGVSMICQQTVDNIKEQKHLIPLKNDYQTKQIETESQINNGKSLVVPKMTTTQLNGQKDKEAEIFTNMSQIPIKSKGDLSHLSKQNIINFSSPNNANQYEGTSPNYQINPALQPSSPHSKQQIYSFLLKQNRSTMENKQTTTIDNKQIANENRPVTFFSHSLSVKNLVNMGSNTSYHHNN